MSEEITDDQIKRMTNEHAAVAAGASWKVIKPVLDQYDARHERDVKLIGAAEKARDEAVEALVKLVGVCAKYFRPDCVGNMPLELTQAACDEIRAAVGEAQIAIAAQEKEDE